MPTIQELQRSFATLHSRLKSKTSIPDIQKEWSNMFGTRFSHKSAKCFLDYYRSMHYNKSIRKGGKGRKDGKRGRRTIRRRSMNRKGGALTGAPLDYSMAAGAPVATYGRFPTEIGTDPASLKNLDVFYQSALSRGCGSENISRVVPPAMGSNAVPNGQQGGRSRKHRKVGGNLLESATMRPYMGSHYPSVVEQGYQIWSGNPAPVPFPSSPSSSAWNFSKADIQGILDPGISPFTKSLDQLASPPPYQTVASM